MTVAGIGYESRTRSNGWKISSKGEPWQWTQEMYVLQFFQKSLKLMSKTKSLGCIFSTILYAGALQASWIPPSSIFLQHQKTAMDERWQWNSAEVWKLALTSRETVSLSLQWLTQRPLERGSCWNRKGRRLLWLHRWPHPEGGLPAGKNLVSRLHSSSGSEGISKWASHQLCKEAAWEGKAGRPFIYPSVNPLPCGFFSFYQTKSEGEPNLPWSFERRQSEFLSVIPDFQWNRRCWAFWEVFMHDITSYSGFFFLFFFLKADVCVYNSLETIPRVVTRGNKQTTVILITWGKKEHQSEHCGAPCGFGIPR